MNEYTRAAIQWLMDNPAALDEGKNAAKRRDGPHFKAYNDWFGCTFPALPIVNRSYVKGFLRHAEIKIVDMEAKK